MDKTRLLRKINAKVAAINAVKLEELNKKKREMTDNLNIITARLNELRDAYEIVSALYGHDLINVEHNGTVFLTDGFYHRVGFEADVVLGKINLPLSVRHFGIKGGGASGDNLFVDVLTGEFLSGGTRYHSAKAIVDSCAADWHVFDKAKRIAAEIDEFFESVERFTNTI